MLAVIPGWELDVDRGPDCLMVKVRKPRGRGSRQPLGEVLWSILDQHFTYRLVLELDKARDLDDETLDELLALYQRVSEHGGMLRICGVSAESRRRLLQRQLGDRLVPYEDREEAVMTGAAPRRPR